MKFTEIKETEALKFINEKQYNTIINGTAKHCTKFSLYMGVIETYKIHPCEMTLKDFYK